MLLRLLFQNHLQIVVFTIAYKYSNQGARKGARSVRETEAEVPPSPRTIRATAGSVQTLFEKVALLYL